MTMTRVPRRVLMTMAITTLVVGATATLALLGCGSDGGSSEMVGPAEDVVLFPGGVDDAKLDATSDDKGDHNVAGINLGDSGHFYDRSVRESFVDNHWFKTKANVSYQVEVIAEGADKDVDLYIGRSAHPYTTAGYWKTSNRFYPLMDGIVFKSAQDGMMYVDVRGYDDAGGLDIPYHLHVRKCQFGSFNQ